MPNNGMNEAGDKMATNPGDASPTVRNKKAGPFHKVKAGSAVVPIYRTQSKGRVRFTVSFYRDGRRMRKMFNSLEDAKKEALFVAQRIQSGMHHVTDLKPHERDSFKAAETLLEKLGIPLYAAVEDYRIAVVQSADQVALESGNAPSIIFKHYRELTTPEIAEKWFVIVPKEGQWEKTFSMTGRRGGRFSTVWRSSKRPFNPYANDA